MFLWAVGGRTHICGVQGWEGIVSAFERWQGGEAAQASFLARLQLQTNRGGPPCPERGTRIQMYQTTTETLAFGSALGSSFKIRLFKYIYIHILIASMELSFCG